MVVVPQPPPLASTVDSMAVLELTSLAVDARHYHAFQRVASTLPLAFTSLRCDACRTRLRRFFGEGGEVVRCLACGVYAHRGCLPGNRDGVCRLEPCRVNLAVTRRAQEAKAATTDPAPPSNHDSMRDDRSDNKSPPPSIFQQRPPADLSREKQQQQQADANVWKSDGPPSHWAHHNPHVLQALTTAVTEQDDHTATATEHDTVPPTNATTTGVHQKLGLSFSLIAKVLQDNLPTLYSHHQEEELPVVVGGEPTTTTTTVDTTTAASDATVVGAPTITPKLAFLTYQKIKRTGTNIGIASVAGGIAGGVVGMCLLGPAGVYSGVTVGRTCAVVGVLVDGGLNENVEAFSTAAGHKVQQTIQAQIEKNNVRIVTIGEEGMQRKMTLVRPNVVTDPEWGSICRRSRKEWQDERTGNGVIDLVKSAVLEDNNKRKDGDIVDTKEHEMNLHDKILLLVSRTLNDKQSLPGFVYRGMIRTFRDRIKQEKALAHTAREECTHSKFKLDATTDNAVVHSPQTHSFSRKRRQDAHSIIKYVTATLLEVRPGFGSSPLVTEMSATAVEGLVFGEVYNEVYEEIVHETRELDASLTQAVDAFQRHHTLPSCTTSPTALRALRDMERSHTSVDKLECCVEFLERISAAEEGADALLKSVCRHLVVAGLPRTNAQISFVEEFARDERLLRGKEGYALVTLQAAVHFLNASEDFERDVFSDA